MAWTDVGAGCLLFVLLQSFGLTLASASGINPAADDAGLAACAIRGVVAAGFVAVQQQGGLPADRWLTADSSTSTALTNDPSVQALRSPLAPLMTAAIFAIVTAACGAALGLEWLPTPRPLPGVGRAADVLIAAPATEELFFRAWLITAVESAGAPAAISIAVSSIAFALWHLPLILTGGASATELLFFASLGAWLAVLYRSSAGSLPLVVGTHAAFNLLVVVLRSAQQL